MSYRTAKDLSSIRASGQVGKTWIYFFSHGEQHRRPYKIPFDPLTPRQLSKRAFFKHGMEYWGNLSPGEKNFYNEKALVSGKPQMGFNYFLGLWLRGEIVAEIIKSVQCDFVAVVDGNNNVNISEVAPAKSVLKVCCNSFSIGGSMADAFFVEGIRFIDSTTIRIAVHKGANIGAVRVGWQVIEYF